MGVSPAWVSRSMAGETPALSIRLTKVGFPKDIGISGCRKNVACFINSFYYFFPMTTTVTSKNMITIPMEIARKFGVKPGFSFDWFDTGRPDEIAIRVIPDRKELSRRLKGAGKSYSPLRDSVHELLQERSEEMA